MEARMTFNEAMAKLDYMEKFNIPRELADEVMTQKEFIARQPHYEGCGCLYEDGERVKECSQCDRDRYKMERDKALEDQWYVDVAIKLNMVGASREDIDIAARNKRLEILRAREAKAKEQSKRGEQ